MSDRQLRWPEIDSSSFRLTVLNPAAAIRNSIFPMARAKRAQPHPPTNFHAYAACTHGNFHRDVKQALAEATPVLLLLRGDFSASERALTLLQKQGRFVAVSLKETGLHQIADQLRDPSRLMRFRRIVSQADGCIAPTPEAADFYRAIRGSPDRVAFIPTPYPVDDRRWNFSRPIDERSGIFIGTREWKVLSRNHLGALFVARRLSEANESTRDGLQSRSPQRRAFDRRAADWLPINCGCSIAFYPTPITLREIARHKIVLQLDTSFVPGQVAGDALLCRVPCVGGNGAIDRLAFPETCGFARSISEIEQMALHLLTNLTAYRQAVNCDRFRGVGFVQGGRRAAQGVFCAELVPTRRADGD